MKKMTWERGVWQLACNQQASEYCYNHIHIHSFFLKSCSTKVTSSTYAYIFSIYVLHYSDSYRNRIFIWMFTLVYSLSLPFFSVLKFTNTFFHRYASRYFYFDFSTSLYLSSLSNLFSFSLSVFHFFYYFTIFTYT